MPPTILSSDSQSFFEPHITTQNDLLKCLKSEGNSLSSVMVLVERSAVLVGSRMRNSHNSLSDLFVDRVCQRNIPRGMRSSLYAAERSASIPQFTPSTVVT